MNPNIRTGTVTGTGAAINIPLGFVPDYVKVVNVEDGTIMHERWGGMGQGTAVQTTNHADTQLSLVAANGLSDFDGDAENGAGFTIGSAASANNKQLAYFAVRNGAIA